MTYVSIISTHEENRSINLLIFDISELTINDLDHVNDICVVEIGRG